MGCKNPKRCVDPARNRSADCDGNRLSFKETPCSCSSHTASSIAGTPDWLRNTGNLTQPALISSPSSPPTSKIRSSRIMLVSDSPATKSPQKCCPLSKASQILRAEKHLEAMWLVIRPPTSPLAPFWLCRSKGQQAFSLNWRVGGGVCSEPASVHSILPCTKGSHLCVLQSICPQFSTLPMFSGTPDWNNTFQLPSGP